MKLTKYLANLGYGSRREVEELIAQRRVSLTSGGYAREGSPCTHQQLRVDDEPLDPEPGSVIMLHKPRGYITSTQDVGALVYDLLPPRFVKRTPVMAPVGRLDRDTTGLLLLTDDGALNHRLTSPRRHLPKIYEADLASDLSGDEQVIFAGGELMLKGEERPLLAAELIPISPRRARIVVREGRYHQVKRMFAAVGNRVESLHRLGMGGLELGELQEGCWRVLTAEEVQRLTAG